LGFFIRNKTESISTGKLSSCRRVRASLHVFQLNW
jgi:hypothetical protein